MTQLIELYDQFITQPEQFCPTRSEDPCEIFEGPRSLLRIKDAPSPQEIQAFLANCGAVYLRDRHSKANNEVYASSRLEAFVSTLIQNSYHAGNNGFYLQAPEAVKIVGTFGYINDVAGTAAKPLKVIIAGSTWFGLRRISDVHAVLKCDAGPGLTTGAKDSYIEVRRTTSFDEFAEGAKNTTFVLNQIGNIPEKRNYMEAAIDDERWADEGHPEDCIFKTSNRDTLAFLVEHVPTKNTVIYLPQQGPEVVERTKDDRPREFGR